MVDDGAVLDAVGEPTRRRLLVLLAEQGESSVTELVEASGLRQPRVSQHLRVLAEASLVAVRAEGRHRHYRLDARGLRAAHRWTSQFERLWQGRLDALDALVSDSTSDADRVPDGPTPPPADGGTP